MSTSNPDPHKNRRSTTDARDTILIIVDKPGNQTRGQFLRGITRSYPRHSPPYRIPPELREPPEQPPSAQEPPPETPPSKEPPEPK